MYSHIRSDNQQKINQFFLPNKSNGLGKKIAKGIGMALGGFAIYGIVSLTNQIVSGCRDWHKNKTIFQVQLHDAPILNPINKAAQNTNNAAENVGVINKTDTTPKPTTEKNSLHLKIAPPRLGELEHVKVTSDHNSESAPGHLQYLVSFAPGKGNAYQNIKKQQGALEQFAETLQDKTGATFTFERDGRSCIFVFTSTSPKDVERFKLVQEGKITKAEYYPKITEEQGQRAAQKLSEKINMQWEYTDNKLQARQTIEPQERVVLPKGKTQVLPDEDQYEKVRNQFTQQRKAAEQKTAELSSYGWRAGLNIKASYKDAEHGVYTRGGNNPPWLNPNKDPVVIATIEDRLVIYDLAQKEG